MKDLITSIKGTIIGNIITISAVFALVVSMSVLAADLTTTPTDVRPTDQTVLRNFANATDTSLVLEPQFKWVDGQRVKGCIDTPAGFMIIEEGSRFEFISYGSKSCDSNFITTLSSVRRGLSPTNPGFGSGTGLSWDAGTTIRVTDYPAEWNNRLYADVVRTMTGSGKLLSNQTTQTWLNAPSVTTAQRDAFTYVSNGDIVYNTTTGQLNQYLAGAWSAIGDTGTSNATTTTAGKVPLSSSGLTLIGSGGTVGVDAVIPSTITTASGGLSGVNAAGYAVKAGFIPVLEDTGFLSGSLLGLGATSSLFLRGDQTWATPNAGSGANIAADDASANPTLQSTSYTPIDSTNLSESIYVESGSTTLFIFNGNATFNGNCPDTTTSLEINIQKDGVEIETGSGGIAQALQREISSVPDPAEMFFSYAYLNRSTGTFTFRPSGKTNDDGGTVCGVTFGDNTSFQAIDF